MPGPVTRRGFLMAATAVAASGAPRPNGVLVDTHVHLFAKDQTHFPYHKNAPYQPPAADLDDYKRFVAESKIDHAIIVHPEPYQDDHRYLEYCFAHEPSPGFFKGTCLFDPIAADTAARMAALMKKNPGRIVALRIHEMGERGSAPLTSGGIKNRDLADPRMKQTWSKARELGLAIQMHFLPFYAPRIGKLAAEFSDVPVVLDHLARAGMGTPQDYDDVLKLAKIPRVYMKFSGLSYSSRQGYPFADAKPTVRKAFDAFGPDRMIWGGLGQTMEDFGRAVEVFDSMFDYASAGDKAKIRGLTAMKLFGFPKR